MAAEREQNRDLTLAPDSYLFQQNVGKGGVITVYRGPCVVNQTGQDQPIRFNPDKREYQACSLEQAVQSSPRAKEGDYVVLENPAEDGTSPKETSQQTKSLKKGRKVIIPGPWSEALWPGQVATVIEGHRLRSNQYLVAIVYNAEEAEENWDKITAVKAHVEAGASDDDTNPRPSKTNPQTAQQTQEERAIPKPDSFAVGTRIVIKGTNTSFFIPCTGLEVVPGSDGKYVREAVTLEQLEYCCLIDESGKKEYPKGPKVVFPRPTQVFQEDSKRRRKFKPIELNTINGIHLKVTADFNGPDIETDITKERHFKEGEELFVTGNTLSIYYPREELAIIQYGRGNNKHYSTAIPKGEGRYVINRETGEIRLVRGPKMLLADPRRDIPVRRILSIDDCKLWYPGNQEAIAYNQELAVAMAASPSGRSGMVSEGDWRKMQLQRSKGGGLESAAYLAAGAALVGADDMAEFEPEEVGEEGGSGETLRRGTTYTQPRTLTLNTKFDGVPRVEVWPGYAVLVVGSEGSRRVVEGPEVILLEYDQKLGFMELSTGKPKTSDRTFRTAYLSVHHNQVGDIVNFESKDHVKGAVKISLRVNFEADTEEDKLKWFSVDNYVKFLCDHVRSVVAGMAKRHTIAEIKANYINLVRDAILGQRQTNGAPEGKSEALKPGRPGLFFAANGMRVVEVEVLDMGLNDSNIAKLLDDTQHQVVESNIRLEQAQKDLEVLRQTEQIQQEGERAKYETSKLKLELRGKSIEDEKQLIVSQIEFELQKLEGEIKKIEVREAAADISAKANLARAKADIAHQIESDQQRQTIRLQAITAETEAAVKRFEAAKDGLHEALIAIQRDDIAARLAEACTVERFLTGDSLSSSVANLLGLVPSLKQFLDNTGERVKENGRNRLKSPEATPATR